MTRDRFIAILLVSGETLAALAAAVLLTLAATVVISTIFFLAEDRPGTLREKLLATRYQVEFPLIEAESGRAVSQDELLRLLMELDEVDRARVEGLSERLVLSGNRSTGEVVAAASRVLEQAGFRSGEFSSRRTLDLVEYVQNPFDRRGLVHALLSIQALIFIGVAALLIRLRLPRPPPGAGTGHGLAGLWGIAIGLAAFGCSMLIGLLLHLIGMPPVEQAWLRDLFDDPATLLMLAPWILVFVPLSEEVFFRAYIFRFVAGRAGLPAGLVVSSTTFAVIHLNPSGIVIYMAVGLLLGLVYARTKNLLAPVVAHATYNGLVLMVATLVGPA